MEDTAIKISNVKKKYRLGQIGGATLQADLQSWWSRVRHKEDPNLKVDFDQRLIGTEFLALNDINLTIRKGESVGIIGGNGAGKSTLLKLISRVTAPTEGTIEVNGRIASMLEVGTGFHPEMTGLENIYLNGAILGMTDKEIEEKVEDIIDFSEVRDFIDTPVKRYSSGMYVKLAFSVAAHLNAEILIMDEVLAVGDVKFQQKCLQKMKDASVREGKTVLYVSHNMSTIRQLCDRVIVLKEGKVQFDGPVDEGISLYLGKDINANSSTIEVTEGMRQPGLENSPAVITKIVMETETDQLTVGNDLKARAFIQNRGEHPEDIYLRIMVKNSFGDPVTMFPLEHSLLVEPCESKTISFLIETGILVPGTYSLDFCLYQIGELGYNKNIDVLRDVYQLTILPDDQFNNGMSWEPNWWGYTQKGYLKVEQTEE